MAGIGVQMAGIGVQMASIGVQPSEGIFQDEYSPPKAFFKMSNTSLGTQGHSTETLGRGGEILDSIAQRGVVKEESPEDEAEILKQIQARSAVSSGPIIFVACI